NDDSGKNQGADVVLESWEDMNHAFRIFGPDASQSADALRRIGEVIDVWVRGGRKRKLFRAQRETECEPLGLNSSLWWNPEPLRPCESPLRPTLCRRFSCHGSSEP